MIKLTTLLNEVSYDLHNDLYITLGNSLPGDERYDARIKRWVKSEKQSTDKNGYVVYDIVLINGTKIKATKEQSWRSWWVIEVDNKKFDTSMGTGGLVHNFRDKFLNDLEKLETELKSHDWFSHMSDENRVVKSGATHLKKLNDLMKKLKKQKLEPEALILWNGHAPKEFKK